MPDQSMKPPPPKPPCAWAVMTHGDLGLPPDPPMGVQPDDGTWVVPLIVGCALGSVLLLAAALS